MVLSELNQPIVTGSILPEIDLNKNIFLPILKVIETRYGGGSTSIFSHGTYFSMIVSV
jgi:hypothetical protein